MCGICGCMRFDGETPAGDAVERMSQALTQRGPDGHGSWSRGAIAFGHRRLAVIDLSPRGDQPLVDTASGIALVFNGCIYNYRALREELVAAGHRFASESDSEVLLRAYVAWGEAGIERLDGMFAFAIRDRDGSLLLGRDRLGIKPLYYRRDDRGLWFASDIGALVAAGVVSGDIDAAGLHHYLTFHGIVPAPRTILADVAKVPPATLLRFGEDGAATERRYWTLRFPDQPADETAVDEAELLSALEQAVVARLTADVPVGVLLSGGLDSSLMVALARPHVRDLDTFSIGFEAAAGEPGNEFAYSDLVARTFATRHHRIDVNAAQLLESLPDCVASMAEPMPSHDVIGFYLLAREVRHHVKVVQCGQGADEIFAGYHWYQAMHAAPDPAARYRQVFCDRDHDGVRSLVDPRLSSADVSTALIADAMAATVARDPVDRALHLDTTVMLVDDPLKRVDNMTMRWGIEARVPFLDHHVVELAARIPAAAKLPQAGKHILKQAARRVLPGAIIDRPKGYFPVPMLRHVSGPVRDWVADVLRAPRSRARAIVRPDAITSLLDDPAPRPTPLGGSTLWQVALLFLWLEARGL